MTQTISFRILGCGSSGGVPRLGGQWGECDPTNPRNRRRRCSVLVTQTGPEGNTHVLIDTSPDMREQLLDANVGRLDGVVYTHGHADHVHGIDDLRMIVFNTREKMQVWADGATSNDLLGRFGYIFAQPKGSSYPPICELNPIDGDISVTGAGGTITLHPIRVEHGRIEALGFRIGNVAYMPDVSNIPDVAWAQLHDLDCWIVDSLRRAPHPSHAHLEKTLTWIARAAPKSAVLTNLHNDLDYTTLMAETPSYIQPAFDGLTLTYPTT